MPRRILTLATVAMVVAIGAGAQAAGPCDLLTADDVASVLGKPVKVIMSSSDMCYYDSGGTKWQGNDAEVHFALVPRDTFDPTIKANLKAGTYHPLSGVGDKAYLSTFGEDVNQSADMMVVKGNTHFSLTVEEDPKHAKSVVALARKVADRIK